ncbi:3-isopropylmalate dehydratase small subunit (plasmid) [Acidiphilium multivorum]|uniref:3-isopropylmalate dehydratase small subunit n=1 Tax=Acidiphilium multivorum TaxID=62140 RepID=UPI001F4BF725|nr:3-isopropylmalate dehydratase small subunit [Acidiphilium multivorum]UNC16536.1 3-isopropylmalate dehydratase small subunit [Acidiphilium multivorum]
MTPFTVLESIAVPFIQDNVDTDTIIPSREIKAVSKRGLAGGLFAGLRYTEIGGRQENPDFVLNKPIYQNAQILMSGKNFGCGSSREQAVWALAEYGFRAILAHSFNPIFRRNCIRNGIVPVELDVTKLLDAADQLVVDLDAQEVRDSKGQLWPFAIETEAKSMLRNGFDEIDLTLLRAAEIEAFRARDRARRPWAYL